MPTIGPALSSFQLQLLRKLQDANASSELHSLRLATGQRINRPSDDPAAFIDISNLQGRLDQVNTTLQQVSAASSLGASLQLAVDQIRTKLNAVRTTLYTDEDFLLTTATRAAAQTTIDAALNDVNALAGTEINGVRPLDGSQNFEVSGVNAAQVRGVEVRDLHGTSTISGTVSVAATRATATYTGASSKTTAAATYTLTGVRGSSSITVANNELLTSVVTKVNNESHRTGITAAAAGNTLTFTTVDYGTSAAVNVAVSSGTFNVTGNGNRGVDAAATINGQTITGQGNSFSLSRNGLEFSLEVAAGYSGAISTITASAGRSLKFALTTESANITRLGLPSLLASSLGGLSGNLEQLRSGGTYAGLNTNTQQAIRVVDEALAKLTVLEGRIDGFADASVASSESLLTGLKTNLESELDARNGISEEEESLSLARSQALAENTLSALSILASQQQSLVDMLKSFAGRF